MSKIILIVAMISCLAFLVTTQSDHANVYAKQDSESTAEKEEKELLGEAKSITLRHDSGETEDQLNVSGGAFYTLEFETPKEVEAIVWQVQIYASQFGRKHDSEAVNGDVYILDEDRKIISRTSFPYSVVSTEKQWVSIPTLPTAVKGKFYICINAHGSRYKGLYMGYVKGNEEGKASTDGIEEDSIVSQDWSKKFKDKQWLIRVKIADRPVVYRN